ncbi:dihydropteroate synthase [Pseudomaricurvus sp. HS19]|uniref:dihydropteroate synthase n=1 Tax=Pseudomaricurvus sp. HS19 TaxID=2692626 RepID=UPI001F0241B0|nr:dihydropteroate synthase [Pseudomaricurvus sp. HS19]
MTDFAFGARSLDLGQPQVMGILNVTPDSFSDGGLHHSAGRLSVEKSLMHAAAMVAAGASIIDVGGESTRPGAASVSDEEELARVVPVVERLAAELDVVISVDTSSPRVIQAVADAGAGLINDVRSLSREGALPAAAASGLPVCIMHMQGQPQTMQQSPAYGDVVGEVRDYLQARMAELEMAGIAAGRVVIDPGFGFGKSVEHNLALLKHLPAFAEMGCPVLAGLSRKSLFGAVLGRDVDARMAGSLAAALLAAQGGAAIIRVHDVQETVDVLRFYSAVQHAQ